MNGALAVLTVLTGLFQAEADAPPPRVIWIAIDSLRADHLHFAGYPRETSPWMDELAASGAAFTSAYAPASSTAFSVGATFTGRYYSLLDHESHPPHIPPGIKTLGETLTEAGVRTHAWIGNVVLKNGRNSGYGRGFQHWETIMPRRAPTPSIDEIVGTVERTYERSDKPEFHYIHTMDVHHPYVPIIPFDRLWPEHKPTPGIRFGEAIDKDGNMILSTLPYHKQRHDLGEESISYLITQYDGAIRYTDERLPALLEAFSYDRDRDILIISADHGEQFYEHGFWGHGRSVFPAETNVPLIIHGPGIVPARHGDAVSLVDLYPTLCDVFEAAHPPGLNGISLMPALRTGSLADSSRAVYTENPYWTGGVFAPEAAVIQNGDFYRIATNVHWREPWRIWPIDEGLYALSADQPFQTNLVPEREQRANELNEILRSINPRYAPYTVQAIRVRDEDVNFGPELMPPLNIGANKRVRVATPIVRQSAENSAFLSVRGRDLELLASTHAGRPHQLKLAYRLLSGAFRLTMRDQKSGESFYEYSIYKSAPEWSDLSVMIAPGGDQSAFTIAAIGSQDAVIQLKDVSLRQAEIPVFEQVQWERRSDGDAGIADSDSVDTQALKALGYID